MSKSCVRGGGANRVAAMKSGAVDTALIERTVASDVEREGFRQILFVGDLIPLPLAGLGTTLEKIRSSSTRCSGWSALHCGNSLCEKQQAGKRKGDHGLGRYGPAARRGKF
jgi:hypothetical protein